MYKLIGFGLQTLTFIKYKGHSEGHKVIYSGVI